MTTHERFKAWRLASGLSQSKVAKLIGCAQSFVRAIEAGGMPGLGTAARIEDISGISMRDWLTKVTNVDHAA